MAGFLVIQFHLVPTVGCRNQYHEFDLGESAGIVFPGNSTWRSETPICTRIGGGAGV